MIKIIGGKHRARSIETPGGMTTRPTSNRARESLFNVLMHANWHDANVHGGTSPLVEARVLDAFAGSGALGIEALSRGAAHATFLDTDATAIRLVGENLRKIGEAANAKVIRGDATRPPPSREPCDLVFLDPPYREGLMETALAALSAAGWIAPGALVCAEYGVPPAAPPPGFTLLADRAHGPALLLILQAGA